MRQFRWKYLTHSSRNLTNISLIFFFRAITSSFFLEFWNILKVKVKWSSNPSSSDDNFPGAAHRGVIVQVFSQVDSMQWPWEIHSRSCWGKDPGEAAFCSFRGLRNISWKTFPESKWGLLGKRQGLRAQGISVMHETLWVSPTTCGL